VAGVGELNINYNEKKIRVGGVTLQEGDYISINGSTGNVYTGSIKTVDARLSGDFLTLMKWADSIRRLGVRTNADTPGDAQTAVNFGAEGIGLCRTEHMFFEGHRITSVRKMILADDKVSREAALKELLPLQRRDFEGIFKIMKSRPVTIRLIDPPLHEFVPHDEPSQKEMARALKVSIEKIRAKVADLQESNPMLGHRGCRLGITYPEIIRMQARAIIEAAINVKKLKIDVHPEIMVPLVGELGEISFCKKVIIETINEVFAMKKTKVPYLIGTMIEVPRGALIADEIAKEAEFFSFGTNDLTQMTCGFSRDDAGKFLKEYVEKGIFEKDPFQVLDQEGVGQLIQIGIRKGRSTRKNLKIGICGEHGGEPSSVEFCHRAGMNYVSCSPFRVPIARLAAAQAVIKEKQMMRKNKNRKK
jgi:pyruvate,orthophosphate dikinase